MTGADGKELLTMSMSSYEELLQKVQQLEEENVALKERLRWRTNQESPIGCGSFSFIVVPRKVMSYRGEQDVDPFVGVYASAHDWFQGEGKFCYGEDVVAWRLLDLPEEKQ